MIDGRTVLALIPARGGSKGLPGKNVRMLCGKPLIAWSIEQALRSTHTDVVVVSTDSPEIADVARAFGAEVPFQRPASLATDTASSYDVIRHAVEHYRSAGTEFAYTALLEPTSPLREDDDIDRMLAQLDAARDEFDSIVSVGEVNEHPNVMKRFDGARLVPFHDGSAAAGRRQDNVPAYFPYGVAYIAKTDVLLRENTYYTRRCMGFPIKRYQNFEIDDQVDFLCVERMMQHRLEGA